MGKPLSWSPFFNEIAGINSRPASLVKKASTKDQRPKTKFTCEYIRTFSASTCRT